VCFLVDAAVSVAKCGVGNFFLSAASAGSPSLPAVSLLPRLVVLPPLPLPLLLPLPLRGAGSGGYSAYGEAGLLGVEVGDAEEDAEPPAAAMAAALSFEASSAVIL
jgi:hypothetical protein